MQLVIVSGQEATGKTEVAKKVAQLLGYEYISKDVIKEKLFDTANKSTWDYGWYEKNAKKQFFADITDSVSKGSSTVIESNFIGEDKSRLMGCLKEEVALKELYCEAKGLTSFTRFVHRNESGNRHRGHHDRRWYLKIFIEDILQYMNIRWPSKPSELTQKLLVVDTTDFTKVNYEKITDFLKQA